MRNRDTSYREYIRRTEEIRALSTPSLDDVESAADYTDKLRENFIRIGELAKENRKFLDSELFPVIASDIKLGDEDIEDLESLSGLLISEHYGENMDVSFASLIEKRLASDESLAHDISARIHRMDAQVGIWYELMTITGRLSGYAQISEHYRKSGMDIADVFYTLLEKDNLAQITDAQLRKIIINDARYSISFFESLYGSVEMNALHLERLNLMYNISEDEFYKEALGDYDWRYHKFRTLQYYAMATERCNGAGFDKEQLKLISERTDELMDFWDDNDDYLTRELDGENRDADMITWVRNRFLTGRTSEEEYIDQMLKLYDNREVTEFTAGECYVNLLIPYELITLICKGRVSERRKALLQKLYSDVLSYAFYMPSGGGMSTFLEVFYKIMDSFAEAPSGISFTDMLLQSMAALHPPTYVHSKMVGHITECLCTHLIRLHPEYFIGVMGCKDEAEVKERADEMISFAYNAALCHDCGKISIIDTIFIYGRRLLDMEFDLIKTHPRTGYDLLMKHVSTRRYADVALGHHRWYDDSHGYPDDFDTLKSPVKVMIDLVLCADCMDAATDRVGRSYNPGKSLDDFIGEIEEGAGTHYAPYLPQLLRDDLVREDLDYLLGSGRQECYESIYYILRGMRERLETDELKTEDYGA